MGTAYERVLRKEGCGRVAGLDEVGRGCLAGPVVAAAVVLDSRRRIRGLNDSKRLRPGERERLARIIRERAAAVSVHAVPSERVDQINVYQASIEAMKGALESLDLAPDALLVDGLRLPGTLLPQRSIAGGDGVCASIAAASIVAKVERDAFMVRLHDEFPVYNFASNKGYATREHRAALAVHGPCPHHRRTFQGVCQAPLPLSLHVSC